MMWNCLFSVSILPNILRAGMNPSPFQTAMGTCCVRWASKKASGRSKNRGGKSPGMRLGQKIVSGEFARSGQVLVRQKLGFRWLPGRYVIMGRKRTINAQVDGRVFLTFERWHPSIHKDFTKEYLSQVSDESMMRKFINIEPEPEVGMFKLVEQI